MGDADELKAALLLAPRMATEQILSEESLRMIFFVSKIFFASHKNPITRYYSLSV